MMRYNFPVDPDCPAVSKFRTAMLEDPMTHAMGAPTDELFELFDRRHRNNCDRCREYGAANVEVV